MKFIISWCKSHPKTVKTVGAAFVAAMGALGYNLPTWWPAVGQLLGAE